MALQLDTIRATADRIAASHSLDIVDLEFSGGAKFRTLRVFIEKNAETRARLAAEAAAAEESELPKNVPTEILSFTTHEDCELFTRDFGTVLDVEDLIPGAEYTLEVSSPGLERKLSKPADFTRFAGSLIKVQTFTAINANRHFQGRLTAFDPDTQVLTLDLTAIKPKGKPKKSAGARTAPPQTVEIAFSNVEKANLIPEL
jgi:ribosome maturation factor RimP